MEISVGLIVLGLIAIFLFRRPIRKVSDAVDSELTSILIENDVENIIAVQESLAELEQECGSNFMTVEQAYKKLHQRRKAAQPQQQS